MVSALGRVLWRDLWHLRGQVLAAALVVACGIATLVATQGTHGALVRARDDYYLTHRFAEVFAHLKRAPEALAEEIRRIPGVAQAQTRIVVEVSLDVPDLAEPAVGRLVSLPRTGEPRLNDLMLVRGRLPEDGARNEVVVSEAFAKANRLSVGDRLGGLLHGRWTPLAIVGVALSPEFVYEVGTGMLLPDNRRYGVLWMGRDALASAFDLDGAFNDVTMTLAAGARERAVIDALDVLLKRHGGLDAHGRDLQLSHQFLRDELEELRVMTTTIPTIFLAVSAFLLYVVLSRLVVMQRTQIGLLKAFGYTDLRVGAHYLGVALTTVGLGLAVGLPAGLALGRPFVDLYRDYFRFPRLAFDIDPALLLLACALSVAAGSLGALLAVRRVVALAPAESMRPEPPASFHAGALDRGGFVRHLPASSRMILRNLLRRPWKAGVSVVLMGFAIGLMVIARFTLDAANHLMNHQFEQVERQDVTVFFNEALGPAAAFSIARMDGVLQSEPFRALPVRLRHEHRVRRVEVLGLQPGHELRRLLDAEGRPVALPPDGLVLVDKLARILGVAPGDTLTVEVLEGARPVVEVPLVAIVDEWLGLGAYMDARALNRLVGQQGTSSGAHLRIRSDDAEAFHARLKRMPVVAGVGLRGAMRQSLDDMMERTFFFFSAILTLFSCVIIGGVVYNSARVALSERGNELASLAVLGFTRREVGVLLLGEQALLTLVAIPVGLAIGYALCALLVPMFDRELFRLPLVLEAWSFVYPAVATVVAGCLSGLLVARRLVHLDLIAVLKTRE